MAAVKTQGILRNHYTITVFTAHKLLAGTDAHVYITLFGKAARTKKVHLRDKNKSCFEKGSKDNFQVALKDVGELRKVRIEHDGTGTAAGWFLDKIIVMKDRYRYVFPCAGWIAADEGDGKLWRELPARGRVGSRAKPTMTRYDVTTTTGDVKFAGTDAIVYVIISGVRGTTGKLVLQNVNKAIFDRGKTDVFTVDGKNIGEVRSILIGHDNSGIGPGWFLNKVTLRRYIPEDEAKTLQKKKHKKNVTNLAEDKKNTTEKDKREHGLLKRSSTLSEFSEFRQLEEDLLAEYEEGRLLVEKCRSNTIETFNSIGRQKQRRRLVDASRSHGDAEKGRRSSEGMPLIRDKERKSIGRNKSGSEIIGRRFSEVSRSTRMSETDSLLDDGSTSSTSDSESDDNRFKMADGQSTINGKWTRDDKNKMAGLRRKQSSGRVSVTFKDDAYECLDEDLIDDREDNEENLVKFEQCEFVCGRWLAKDEEDGLIERELVPQSQKLYY